MKNEASFVAAVLMSPLHIEKLVLPMTNAEAIERRRTVNVRTKSGRPWMFLLLSPAASDSALIGRLVMERVYESEKREAKYGSKRSNVNRLKRVSLLERRPSGCCCWDEQPTVVEAWRTDGTAVSEVSGGETHTQFDSFWCFHFDGLRLLWLYFPSSVSACVCVRNGEIAAKTFEKFLGNEDDSSRCL